MEKQLLTHSWGSSFKGCRRRSFWEYEVKFRKVTDAKPLRMGSAGHDGLDALKQGGSTTDAIAAVWQHYKTCPEGVDQYDWDIERETVECLVMMYEWRWRDANIATVATEKSFRLPLTNPTTGAATPVFDVAGKVDGLVVLEDGRKAIIEHKFISDDLKDDSDFWRRLQLDSQVSMYVWAARQIGWEVETALYDCIRKPSIKPTAIPLLDEDGLKVVVDVNDERVMTKAGKPRQSADKEKGWVLYTRPMTIGEWSTKLIADITARPEFYYARREIPRLDSDIEEFLFELWDLQKTLREAQRENRWYKTVGRDSCPYCAFFGLCSSRFDPSTGEVPEGFVKVENCHPELDLESEEE